MPVKLERRLPTDMYIKTTMGNYKIEIMKVGYTTLYDFVWQSRSFETELKTVLEDWREPKLELEICLIDNVIDNNRLYLTYVRVVATSL